MKTFNVNLDQEMNVLAVAFANGDSEAGDKFAEKVKPLLEKFASRKFSLMEKEDLVQEFLIVAIQKAYDFAERYNDGKNNVLGLIYTACKRKLIDLGRNTGAEKRSRTFTIGDETYNREVSLQTKIGEDGDSTLSDKIASEQKSVEQQVMDSLNETAMAKVIEDFAKNTKGRNSLIVPLVYKASVYDCGLELLNNEIAKVLFQETGVEPTNEAIRQAKSRAVKALRKAIETEQISFANQLQWEL